MVVGGEVGSVYCGSFGKCVKVIVGIGLGVDRGVGVGFSIKLVFESAVGLVVKLEVVMVK